VAAQFLDDENLTPLGKSVKRRLRKICRNARGNAGQLTSLGARQHRGIAQRMVRNFPTVFAGNDARIQARSSTVPRCRASMLAFISQLPCRGLVGETRPEFMSYINYESPELKELSSRTKSRSRVSASRFVSSLFRDTTKVTDGQRLLGELHTIASDMQDIPLNVSLWDIFTQEEMIAVHDANNERMTVCNGDTSVNDGIPARSSIALWKNIEQEADSMIASGGHGASLRFGHDTALFRLLTLLGIQLPGTGMEDIIPMGANLQMVFVHSLDYVDSGIWVLFLLNEQIVTFNGVPAVYGGCFYHWNDVKYVVNERTHQLEHLRQLSALNTMVGTAPANTQTAGLFGKGSEEHGQTLPAVLVPNGQTFWTPQTQTSERKCIAPYYYQDTLFYGIRASHWLVGGCTQDYGSFTVGAFKSNQTSGLNGTPFSHSYEISHPHYYSITLPREQLNIELTALSHSAIMRVTPYYDGLVNVVLTVNSDEQQGTISMPDDNGYVYASNPVHRIYQGWGEPAGFSGHFIIHFKDSLIATSKEGQTLYLTFQGRKNQPIELRMGTSFTNGEGAQRNLTAEAAQFTFGQMRQRNAELWIKRLHAIDVTDPDTARVNQFYGALYRASFLPREMSDVDGTYPLFATGIPTTPTPSTTPIPPTRYGDFSMWDTYRALHPLLCIIAPEANGQMMQSLVDMADEGGWLPIFPCWNSYTAAMIGDHCTSVLADAYVKGIQGFDATKAYRFMRKNAFERPATIDEYRNGMGRRALESYMQYGYIPLEDSVRDAFHQQEQTSRTLEYAYDDFCVAQMARALSLGNPQYEADYRELMQRSENWLNVINPMTGYADGRHADGSWENNRDLVSRQPYITEGATCHYTWYVPHNIPGLIEYVGGNEAFVLKLDSMFNEGRYWHGNEPCHQVAWLYSLAGQPELTCQHVSHLLQTEYNDSPGGLSGNDDAGQMSAWQVFASMGFYPVCPGTPLYVLGGAWFKQVTINSPGGQPLTIMRSPDRLCRLNGQTLAQPVISHSDLLRGGLLQLPSNRQ
jgi:predicted alpha-1,2-mannosidase